MSRARTLASLALCCGLLAVPATAAQAATCAGSDAPPVAGNESQMDQATLCLLNQQRAAAGLPALTENSQLDQSSAAYSQRMVSEQFFDHTSPDGTTVTDRLTQVGYLPGESSWTAGENIAWGQGTLATPQSIMTAWMNSPGHRANILSPAFSDIGLGVAIGTPVGGAMPGATYTTDFGRHVSGDDTTQLSTYQSQGTTVAVTVKPKAKAKPKAKVHHVIRCARTAVKLSHAHLSHGARLCRTTRAHARARAHAKKR